MNHKNILNHRKRLFFQLKAFIIIPFIMILIQACIFDSSNNSTTVQLAPTIPHSSSQLSSQSHDPTISSNKQLPSSTLSSTTTPSSVTQSVPYSSQQFSSMAQTLSSSSTLSSNELLPYINYRREVAYSGPEPLDTTLLGYQITGYKDSLYDSLGFFIENRSFDYDHSDTFTYFDSYIQYFYNESNQLRSKEEHSFSRDKDNFLIRTTYRYNTDGSILLTLKEEINSYIYTTYHTQLSPTQLFSLSKVNEQELSYARLDSLDSKGRVVSHYTGRSIPNSIEDITFTNYQRKDYYFYNPTTDLLDSMYLFAYDGLLDNKIYVSTSQHFTYSDSLLIKTLTRTTLKDGSSSSSEKEYAYIFDDTNRLIRKNIYRGDSLYLWKEYIYYDHDICLRGASGCTYVY